MKPETPEVGLEQAPSLRLFEFSFQSLYFCRTPFSRVYATSMESTINQEYMRLIQGGWAVPMSFVLDIARWLTWRPEMGDQSQLGPTTDPLLIKIADEYKATLQKIRQSAFSMQVVEKLRSVKDERKRRETVRLFLEFLVEGLKDSPGERKPKRTSTRGEVDRHEDEAKGRKSAKIYTFDTRQMSVAIPALALYGKGISKMQVSIAGVSRQRAFSFVPVDTISQSREFAAAAELTARLCSYYKKLPMDQFLKKEHALLLDIAMRSDEGVRWVDLRLIEELVAERNMVEADEAELKPRQVEKIVPTDHSEEDGATGGYTDVQTKHFSNCVADLLPVELAVADQELLFYQKLLNEGALHYIRENPENIEKEYRILICFVIDSHAVMNETPRRLHGSFGKGLTASHRARDLASRMIQDLALHLPRKDVRVDCGLYLWSADPSHAALTRNAGKPKYGANLDLFAWTPKADRERLPFLSRLSDQAPSLFHVQSEFDLVDLVAKTTEKSVKHLDSFKALDPSPARYLITKRNLRPHSTHVVHFTSKAVPAEFRNAFGTDTRDDPKINAMPYTRNSIWVVYCDVTERSISVLKPQASWFARPDLIGNTKDQTADSEGRLSEEQLRFWFLDTVLSKAGGKPMRSGASVLLEGQE